MLERITPAVITYNEAPNIGRMLERLAWAREVVVVDSMSTDETLEIARGFANVRTVEHPFESLADQWTFAAFETGIETDWVLRLDADYILPPALIEELGALDPGEEVAGYRARFVYCIHGRPLRASLYPPRVRLFRRQRGRFYQDGHSEELAIDGAVLDLAHPIHHDDRKPLTRWIAGQDRYMADEAAKIADAARGTLGLPDRLRRRKWIAPLLVFLYCLFGKGLILDGRAGFYYAYQRAAAEIILALHLMDRERGDG
jgi:glycosyltransferase involved in cell wall biosynthesis